MTLVQLSALAVALYLASCSETIDSHYDASAFCSTNGARVMSRDTASTPRPSITVRPTPEEKARFAALAAARGESESDLGLEAVRLLLRFNPGSPSLEPLPPLKDSSGRG